MITLDKYYDSLKENKLEVKVPADLAKLRLKEFSN